MTRAKIVSVALASLLLAAGSAFAFHDGGVAYCAGCHTMHNSQDGASITGNLTGYPYLLKNPSPSDQCLSCHANYGQFRGGTGHGPGGDFYWVTKTYTHDTGHGITTSTGDSHGHNIYAPARSLAVDGTLATAPGGTFSRNWMSCTSCHDPHGNENFRILYGTEVGPIYSGGRYNFTADAPLAAGNSRRTYVGSGGEETNSRHTIYKSGMSDWCGNCHSGFHDEPAGYFVHPTGEALGPDIAANYNGYISSDNLTGGVQASSYWGAVPFEAVNVDLATADPTNYTLGPDAGDQVACITCHRAHASAFPDIGRWYFAATFINADSVPLTGDGGATADDVANKYYQYTFVDNQRSLCNKCHVKDLGDAPYVP